MLLEASLYTDNAFVTLTYAEDPTTLSIRDYQLWLKRLRKAVAPHQFRFVLVGEYGDETFRPHYHAALFNFRSCEWGQSRYSRSRQNCCGPCDLVRDTWGLGHIQLGTFTPESAQYVVGYVTKKMTSKDDPRLGNRYPEFQRSSRMPGIGVPFLHEAASEWLRLGLDHSQADVPSALAHGTRNLPLGDFMKRKLRTFIGKEANAPQNAPNKYKEEMQAVWDDVFADTKNLPGELRRLFFKNALIDKGAVKVGQIENRARIFKQRKHI